MIIYESELPKSPDMSVFPEACSLTEAMFYVLEANEQDFTELIQNIGIKELAVFESTGEPVVYTEGSEEAKEVTANKVSFISKAAARVLALFEKIMRAVNELFTKVVASIGKKFMKDKEGLKAAVDKLPKDYSVKSYQYGELFNVIDAAKQGTDNGTSKIKTALNRVMIVAGDEDDSVEAVARTGEKIKSDLGIDGDFNAESIKKVVRGAELNITKDVLKSNFEAYYNFVKDSNSANKNLKSLFKTAKANFNNNIKDAKKAKDHSKEELAALKQSVQVSTLIYSAVLNEFYAVVKRDVSIFVTLHKYIKKKGAAGSEEDAQDTPGPDDGGSGDDKQYLALRRGNQKVKGNSGNPKLPGGNQRALGLDLRNYKLNADKAFRKDIHQESSAIDTEIQSMFDWSF